MRCVSVWSTSWILAALLLPPVTLAIMEDATLPRASPELTPDREVPSATVRLTGQALFEVRGSSSLSAAERAAAISERIEAAARDPDVNPDDIRIVATPIGEDIVAGKTRIMRVFPADGEFESMPYLAVAEHHASRLRQAVRTYREERQPGALVRDTVVSLVATALLVLVLWLAAVGFRWLDALIDKIHLRATEPAAHPDAPVSEFPIWRPVHSFAHGTHWLLRLALVFVWLHVVLAQFPVTRWLSDNLAHFVVEPIIDIGEGMVGYLPNLLFLLVLFIVTRYALKMVHLYFSAIERGSTRLRGFEPEWSMPMYKLVRALVIALALIMGYPYLPGAGTDALKGISLFTGVLFSLGASTAVSSVIAGYMNTFGRVFKVGDLIQVGETLGTVTNIRVMTTRIRTIRNEEVSIPNSILTGNSLINYSALARERGLILQTEVGIGYEVSWRQVHAMLLDAARRTPDLLTDPAPFVLQRRLGDFAITYQLNVYKGSADDIPAARSALHQNILDVFNENGVQIMTPAYEGDPETPKVVAKENWFTPPVSPRTESDRG
jgi:small-conductance mechanosensitive channel